MPDGICQFAVWRPTANFGYPQGERGLNQPRFFVDHIMAGFKRTLDDAGWREPNGVGVHFGIGKDGSLSQYTNIFDASWGNGVSGSRQRYDRSNRHLAALEAEPGAQWIEVPYAGTIAFALVAPHRGRPGYRINLPNSRSISIEHEGQPGDPWTPEMLAADIQVKRWCIAEVKRVRRHQMEVEADLLVGHFQIDAVNRAQCPGPNRPKTAILQALREEEDMKAILIVARGRGDYWLLAPDTGLRYPVANPVHLQTLVSGGALDSVTPIEISPSDLDKIERGNH